VTASALADVGERRAPEALLETQAPPAVAEVLVGAAPEAPVRAVEPAVPAADLRSPAVFELRSATGNCVEDDATTSCWLCVTPI
jgi:hypothetical protein